MNKIILSLIAIVAVSAVGTYIFLQEQDTPVATSTEAITSQEVKEQAILEVNLDEQGRALHGNDPVAYFEAGQSVLGTENLNLSWNKATWQFSSVENKSKFEQNPEKFIPANGGFCTFGVALGKKFDGDPNVWHIKEGQLYVFLNSDIKNKFMQDEDGNIEKANNFWPQIKDKSPEDLETGM